MGRPAVGAFVVYPVMRGRFDLHAVPAAPLWIALRSKRRCFLEPTSEAATANDPSFRAGVRVRHAHPARRSNDCLLGITRTVERRDETVCAHPLHPARGSGLPRVQVAAGSPAAGSGRRGAARAGVVYAFRPVTTVPPPRLILR